MMQQRGHSANALDYIRFTSTDYSDESLRVFPFNLGKGDELKTTLVLVSLARIPVAHR